MNTKEFRIEMVRHSDTGYALAEYLNISPTTMSLKINGKAEFTQGEIMKIKERWNLTPERIDELFFASNVSCEDTVEIESYVV